MATSTERARRHRAHQRGDHRLCLRSSCDVAGSVASVAAAATPVATMGPRGRRLWDAELADGPPLNARELSLLEEACRLVDRLDRLDAILAGREDAWLRLRLKDDGVSHVVVDKALSEARQQAIAMKSLLAELRQSRSSRQKDQQAPGKPPFAGGQVQSGNGGGLSGLAGAVRAKAQTTGRDA